MRSRKKERPVIAAKKPKLSDRYSLHVRWIKGHLGKFDRCDRHDPRDRNVSILAIAAITVATIAAVANQGVSIWSLRSLRSFSISTIVAIAAIKLSQMAFISADMQIISIAEFGFLQRSLVSLFPAIVAIIWKPGISTNRVRDVRQFELILPWMSEVLFLVPWATSRVFVKKLCGERNNLLTPKVFRERHLIFRRCLHESRDEFITGSGWLSSWNRDCFPWRSKFLMLFTSVVSSQDERKQFRSRIGRNVPTLEDCLHGILFGYVSNPGWSFHPGAGNRHGTPEKELRAWSRWNSSLDEFNQVKRVKLTKINEINGFY